MVRYLGIIAIALNFFCFDVFSNDNAKLEPFFVDGADFNVLQRKFPRLSVFDEAILGVCGNLGSVPSVDMLHSMLQSGHYSPVLSEIYRLVDSQITVPLSSLDDFVREMSGILSPALSGNNSFFLNTFCGNMQKTNKPMDGLAFIGRYYEANRKWAGIDLENHDPGCAKVVQPPVYNFPAVLAAGDKDVIKICRIGYVDESAMKIISDAILVYKSYYHDNRPKDADYTCYLENYSSKYAARYWKKFLFSGGNLVLMQVLADKEATNCHANRSASCPRCIVQPEIQHSTKGS